MNDPYFIIKDTVEGQIVVKKSRFIATVAPVADNEKAMEFISSMKKKYHDARHNCSAYILGGGLSHSSDDGEPSGTAGRPMLDVLSGERLCDVCAVVTRYFGGVLLGTGGLVRAYQGALLEALKGAEKYEIVHGFTGELECSYNDYGKISNLMKDMGVSGDDGEFGANVKMPFNIPFDLKDAFEKKVTDISNGSARIKFSKEAGFFERRL